MAIDTGQLHGDATDKVLAGLTKLYKDTEPDPDAMRGFAEAIASIAVATAEHFIARAEIKLSGDGIH
ncbi:MAG: hypothetical protein WD397_17355 [Wenzhouxiangellaceae bacterium]